MAQDLISILDNAFPLVKKKLITDAKSPSVSSTVARGAGIDSRSLSKYTFGIHMYVGSSPEGQLALKLQTLT